MKLFKLLFSLLFLLTLTTTFSIAAGTRTACKNEPVKLNWSSSGCDAPTFLSGANNGACNFTASANTIGERYPISLSSGSCTVNISCSNTGGNGADSATLTVDETRIWNGSSCVSAARSGNIYGSCTVAIGATHCTGPGPYVTWSSANLVSPNIRINSNDSLIMSGAPNGSESPAWINGGGVLFELRDGAQVISSAIIGNCATGSTWSPSEYKCVANVSLVAPTGSHDYISAGNTPITYGWAIDSDTPNAAVTIHFYMDGVYGGGGTFVGSTSAGVFRGDGGIGNHGFEWNIPTNWCDNTTHTLYAFAINTGAGNNPLLAGSPKTFTCGPTPQASGNISANPNPCTIAVGASNCTSTISWASTNNPSPNVRVDYSPLLSNAANGNEAVSWISYYGNIFELRNGSTILNSVTVSGVCTSGSSWNGSSCATNPCANGANNPPACNTFTPCTNGANNPPACNICTAPQTLVSGNCITPGVPSGNISATPCIITIGASSCSSSVSWNTQNLTGNPTAVTYPSGITLSTLTNSGGVSNTVNGITSRTYYLYHNGVLLDQTSITSACDTGSDWNGSSCVASTCANGATNYPTCNAFPSCANGLNNTYQPLCTCPSGQDQLQGNDYCSFALNNNPVRISAFLVQPNQIACPGGNDEATLKFILANTPGKTCRISAKEINASPVLVDKTEQITTLNSNTQLGSNKYRSSNSSLSGYTKTLQELIDDRNAVGVSGGQINMSAPKFTSGKRLFNYSTRFNIECDSINAVGGVYSNPNATTYSKKSVDMISICIGQD